MYKLHWWCFLYHPAHVALCLTIPLSCHVLCPIILSSLCLILTYLICTRSALLSCLDVEAVLQQLPPHHPQPMSLSHLIHLDRKCSHVLFWCRSCLPAAVPLLSSPCPTLTYSIKTGNVLLSCPDVEAVLQQLSPYYTAHVPLSPIPFGQEVFSCPVLM